MKEITQMQYRKKPVIIEAIRWNGANLEELKNFVGSSLDWGTVTLYGFTNNKQMLRVVIHTLEGDHEAKVGDYIIKGVQGEFYPCKPEIFAKTYEAVEYPTCNESARRDMELSRKTHCEF